jgi:hypothetical protein
MFGEDALCVVCQCPLSSGEEAYTPSCKHAIHRACADTYVREWRLNHEARQPPCPTCKSEEAFDLSLFPEPENLVAERARRAQEASEEQQQSDARVAEDLFYEDFGDFIIRRRAALRRRDLEIILRMMQ